MSLESLTESISVYSVPKCQGLCTTTTKVFIVLSYLQYVMLNYASLFMILGAPVAIMTLVFSLTQKSGKNSNKGDFSVGG